MKVELNRKKIRELRKKNHFTQEQFAELVDISDRHLRYLETSSSDSSATVLCRISLALEVSMDDLMTVVDQPSE